MKITKLASLFIVVIALIVILVGGKYLLIPFMVAFMVYVFIREIRYLLNKIKLFRIYVPKWLQSAISFLIICSFFSVVVRLITSNIQTLSGSLQLYETNIGVIISSINSTFEIDLMMLLKGFSEGYDFSKILLMVINSIRDLFGRTILVLIYVLFILLEESVFDAKIKFIYPDENRYQRVSGILSKIQHSIRNYITLKTLTSFTTGFLSYFAFLLIGIEAPLFWAFLIFVLNFIPTIGSLIATGFPAIFALLQFGEFWPLFMVVIIVGAIQIIVGSIIEPRIMGDSFNISPLVVIIALSFWATIWGIIGMILSVPITVIMIIIFSEFPATRPVAIMLSEKGKIGDPQAQKSNIIQW
jgi:AI-2 transport protein TqsA